MLFSKVCSNKKYPKFIEVKLTIFINFWCSSKCQKSEQKVPGTRENLYLSVKTLKVPGHLMDPGLSHKWLSLLAQFHFATLAIFGFKYWTIPLGKILDPYLVMLFHIIFWRYMFCIFEQRKIVVNWIILSFLCYAYNLVLNVANVFSQTECSCSKARS